MSSILAIAESGLQVASLQLDVSAHDVANVLTDGFQPGRVEAEELPGGGVAGQVVPQRDPAFDAQVDRNIVALSGTDLVRETVTQISAAAAFRANLATLRAAQETDEALLSVRS